MRVWARVRRERMARCEEAARDYLIAAGCMHHRLVLRFPGWAAALSRLRTRGLALRRRGVWSARGYQQSLAEATA